MVFNQFCGGRENNRIKNGPGKPEPISSNRSRWRMAGKSTFVTTGEGRGRMKHGLTSAEGLVPQCLVAEGSPGGTLVLLNMVATRLLSGFSAMLLSALLLWVAL